MCSQIWVQVENFLLPFFMPNFVLFIVSSGVQISLASRDEFLFFFVNTIECSMCQDNGSASVDMLTTGNGSIREAAGDTEGKRQSTDSLCWRFSSSVPFLYIFWGRRACCLHKILFLTYVYFLHFMSEVFWIINIIFSLYSTILNLKCLLFSDCSLYDEVKSKHMCWSYSCMWKYGDDNYFQRSFVTLFSVRKRRFIRRS